MCLRHVVVSPLGMILTYNTERDCLFEAVSYLFILLQWE
jgi:hypothetical protein